MKTKELSIMKNRITIHICSKDRHTELFGLLQSLRTQTNQNWDVIALDDASGTPIVNTYFLSTMFNRLKLEGHKIKLLRNNTSFGCCAARNKCIEEDTFGNEFTLRLDDDILPNPDYIEKLMDAIDDGYDMASGVIPAFNVPEIKREIKFVGDIINEKRFNDEGDIIKYGDDCGFCYIEDKIIQTAEFRTNCLYKSEINQKVKYPEHISHVAFREEGHFSIRAILEGYKIAVNTAAVCYHLATPSGGNRCQDYQQKVQLDNEIFYKWMKQMFKKHGNFLEVYYKDGIYKNKKT